MWKAVPCADTVSKKTILSMTHLWKTTVQLLRAGVLIKKAPQILCGSGALATFNLR